MSRFPSLYLSLLLTSTLLITACSESDANSVSGEPSEGKASVQSDALATYDDTRVGHFGYGLPASVEQIAAWNIDIRPDGEGLPEGSGSVEDGEMLYEDKCAQCHGTFGEGEGRFPVLAGGQGTLKEARPTKTVGSYWPYTSTLFDYIYRAMPFTQPESLSPDETYALTAYVLYLNDLVEDDFVLNRDNLADIHLPNEGNFSPDPRPDVANQRCMENCRDPEAIKILSEVTPTKITTQDSGGPANAELEPGTEPNHPGQKTYQQYCSICHANGVAGAPKVGNPANWASRLEKGIDALIVNANKGVTSKTGAMPPKGGFSQLSDDEVGNAVNYMVEASR